MSTESIYELASDIWIFNPVALRKAKIVYNFGLSECNRVKNLINRGNSSDADIHENPDKDKVTTPCF